MRKIREGDIVSRYSYGHDIIFIVEKIIRINNSNEVAILKGIDVRILCDSLLNDLKVVGKEEQKKREKSLEERIICKISKEKSVPENRIKEVAYSGKILHLDGDKKYSEKSKMYYKKMGLKAIVKNITENKQFKVVDTLLQIYNPDILVITRT